MFGLSIINGSVEVILNARVESGDLSLQHSGTICNGLHDMEPLTGCPLMQILPYIFKR